MNFKQLKRVFLKTCVREYVVNISLKKFHMERCKFVSTPLIVNEKLSKYNGDIIANNQI